MKEPHPPTQKTTDSGAETEATPVLEKGDGGKKVHYDTAENGKIWQKSPVHPLTKE